MHLISIPRLAALASCLLSVSGHAQNVVVVDPTGGAGTFSSIQPAVDAAASGDTVLIKSGFYPASTTINKPLSLVADTGALVQVGVFWRITGLGAGSTILLDGLSFNTRLFGPAIDVSDCSGTVWFEDCSIRVEVAASGSTSTPGALRITDCPAVVVHDCDVVAGLGASGGIIPDGLMASSSSVYFFGGTAAGGPGFSTLLVGAPTRGGSGLAAIDSFVHTQGTRVTGGVGGSGAGLAYCLDGAVGGSAVTVSGPSARVQAVEATLVGGVGGTSRAPCVGGSAGAQVTTTQGGTFAASDRRAYSLDADGPVRVGSTVTYDVRGPSETRVWLLVSRAPMPQFSAALRSPLLVEATDATLVRSGTLSPSGTLQITMTAPPLPPGAQVMTLYAQVLAFDSGVLTSGAGDAVTILDASF